jgi:predicted ATPase
MNTEPTIGGGPPDEGEAALLAALRARGLHALAEMVIVARNESQGDVPRALVG